MNRVYDPSLAVCITLEMEVCIRAIYLCVFAHCDAVMQRTYLRGSYHASHTLHSTNLFVAALAGCCNGNASNANGVNALTSILVHVERNCDKADEEEHSADTTATTKICFALRFCVSCSGSHLRSMLAKLCHTNYDFIHHVHCVIV